MDTRWIKLCFLLILCPEYFGLADSATVQGTLDPKPPIKGSPHTIKCDFNLGGDSLQQLKLYLGAEALAQNAVAFISTQGTAVWGSSVPASLNQRGYLQGSRDENYLSLVINSTDCSDKDKIYLCALETLSSGSVAQVVNANITSLSQLQAAPLAPSEMQRTPASETVVQHSNMTFECSGNVGRPAGTFRWYTYTGSGSSTGLEVTSQAVSENEVLSGCTYTRVSRLTLNLTRTEPSERLVVRCRVDQALVPQGQTGCSDPDTEFCRMSPGINVQYPVRVSATSDTVSAQEGSDLTLQCFASGNPPPSGLGWQREGENETTAGASLTLGSISMGDAGTYVCSAFNTIDGVQQNASYAVTVVVEKTTTVPPTTTTVTTSTESTTADKEADEAGSDDNNITTVVVVTGVVVVVVVVIIVIVAVIILRRIAYQETRRKRAEPQTERPMPDIYELTEDGGGGGSPCESADNKPAPVYSSLQSSDIGVPSAYSQLAPYRNVGADVDQGPAGERYGAEVKSQYVNLPV